MIERFRAWSRRHRDFLLLLALFVTLRLYIVVFTRAGGFWLDTSDYWWYYQAAALTDHGYLIWRDFWADYPPLFYALVVGLYRLASLLPTWSNPHLWFYVFFGTVVVLAETGSFVMLYWLARRLYCCRPDAVLRPLWLYAGLFGPLFVLAGYFDQIALFWLLLSLVLVVRGNVLLSAVPAGIGFMVKLFPILIAPAAFKLASPRAKAGYVVALALTLIATNLPFYLLDPEMFVASWRAMAGQPAWQTIWALLDGNRSFGMIAGNRFDPSAAIEGVRPETVPWFLVLGLFGVIFLALWSRRWEGQDGQDDADRVRRIVAFLALTVSLFFLFSKGWSPQFIAWVIPFIMLLIPNGWGVGYSLLMSSMAVLDRVIVFVLLSTSTWMLEGIVYLRTVVLAVLTVEFAVRAGLLPAASWMRVRRRLAGPAVALLALLALGAAARGLSDYRAMMAAATPYRPLLDRLAPVVGASDALVTTSRQSFDEIASYWPGPVRVWPREEGEERPETWEAAWEELLGRSRTVWLLQDYRGGLNAPWNAVLADRLAALGFPVHEEWLSDQQRLVGFALGHPTAPEQRASDACFDTTVCLRSWQRDEEPLRAGAPLRVRLTWEVSHPPQTNLNLFVQLLSPGQQLAVGRDLAFADGETGESWQAGTTVTTRVGLLLPATLATGRYTLITGLYDPTTGERLRLANGADFFVLGEVMVHREPLIGLTRSPEKDTLPRGSLFRGAVAGNLVATHGCTDHLIRCVAR